MDVNSPFETPHHNSSGAMHEVPHATHKNNMTKKSYLSTISVVLVFCAVYITLFLATSLSQGFFIVEKVGVGWVVIHSDLPNLSKGDAIVAVNDYSYDPLGENPFPVLQQNQIYEISKLDGAIETIQTAAKYNLSPQIVFMVVFTFVFSGMTFYTIWKVQPTQDTENKKRTLWLILFIASITNTISSVSIQFGAYHQLQIPPFAPQFTWITFTLLLVICIGGFLNYPLRLRWVAPLLLFMIGIVLLEMWLPRPIMVQHSVTPTMLLSMVLVVLLSAVGTMFFRQTNNARQVFVVSYTMIMATIFFMVDRELANARLFQLSWALQIFNLMVHLTWPIHFSFGLFNNQFSKQSRLRLFLGSITITGAYMIAVFTLFGVIGINLKTIDEQLLLAFVAISSIAVIIGSLIWGESSRRISSMFYGDLANVEQATNYLIEHIPETVRNGRIDDLISNLEGMLGIEKSVVYLSSLDEYKSQDANQDTEINPRNIPSWIVLTIPLRAGNGNILGYWLVGPKKHNMSTYAPWERQRLREFAQHISTATELFHLNQALKDEVEENGRLMETTLRQSKEATIGQVAARYSHELMTPLQTLLTYIQTLDEDQIAPTETEIMQRQVNYMAQIIRSTGNFARPSSETVGPVNVVEVMEDVQNLTRGHLRKVNATILTNISQSRHYPDVQCSHSHLIQVLTALVVNACDAMATWKGKKEIQITLLPMGDTAIIQVQDTGPGVPSNLTYDIFSQYVTTKQSGLGLGLPIAKQIVEMHGGSLTLLTESEQTTFELTLPLAMEVNGVSNFNH